MRPISSSRPQWRAWSATSFGRLPLAKRLEPAPHAIAGAVPELDGRGDVLPIFCFVREPDGVAFLDFERIRHVGGNFQRGAVMQEHLITPHAHDPALDHSLTLCAGRLRDSREAHRRPGHHQRRRDHQYSNHGPSSLLQSSHRNQARSTMVAGGAMPHARGRYQGSLAGSYGSTRSVTTMTGSMP